MRHKQSKDKSVKFLKHDKKREYSLTIIYKDALDLEKSQEVVFREGEKTKFGPLAHKTDQGSYLVFLDWMTSNDSSGKKK